MATASTSSGRRILRIGVLLGGKIIEERLVRERTPVTVGQSAKNMFSIPLETLPREWALFVQDGAGYQLRFSQKMDGRLSDGGQLATFEQLKGGRAQQRGDHWALPITDQARGKIALGELTLLFQFVAEPPLQPKPVLPASVRGSMSDRVDPRLAVIVSSSLLLHIGMLTAAMLHELPEKRAGWGRRAPVTVQLSDAEPMDKPVVPEDDKPAEDDKGDKPVEDEKPAQDDKPKNQPKNETKQPKDPGPAKPAGPVDPEAAKAARAAEVARLQDEAKRYAAVLAGGGTSDSGVEGSMSGTAPPDDLRKTTKEVEGSGAAVGVGGRKDGVRGPGGSGPAIGTTTGPDVKGSEIDSGPKKEVKVPKAIVKPSKVEADEETSLSPDGVLKRITSVYLQKMARCYESLLKTDPTAGGKITLGFTVNETGKVVSPSVKSDYGELSSCIKGQMSSWSFPPPKDEDGEATEATFQMTIALSAG